jgi:hypothetical protein
MKKQRLITDYQDQGTSLKMSSVIWNTTPYSQLKLNRHFCLLPASCWFLAWLILGPRRWRRHVPPKRRLTFNGLQGVISQKILLFITTAVRTSNPT